MHVDSKKEIEELEQQAEKLKDEMKYELIKLTNKSRRVVTFSLLAGAGVLSVVVLTKLLSKDKKKQQIVVEKQVKPKKAKSRKAEVALSSRLKTAGMTILLEVGRRKMMDFLNKRFNDNKPS